MINSSLNAQIRNYRTSRKMTLAVLAERLGVTASAVAAYENGTRNPSFDVLIKMARLFNVTVDNLLGSTNRDLIDVSDLTFDQREQILSIISAYKKLNFLAIEMLNPGENKLSADMIIPISNDIEGFKEFVKNKRMKNKV